MHKLQEYIWKCLCCKKKNRMFLSNMVLYKFNVHTAIASLERGNKQNKTKKKGG